jgi:uncharacterized protein
MTSRRRFLAGLLAAGIAPKPTWADAGSPAYLAAARLPDGAYRLFGLNADGGAVFSVPIPDRGHAAAAHPTRPEAVAFARRPGTFAVVLDCAAGEVRAKLDLPGGRHFYGHGAFSRDGGLLFTTENDIATGAGVIGVWDPAAAYVRLGEFPSGGTGPHEMLRLPGSDILAVANGGIETHPDSGREALNLATMRSNLAYLDAERGLLDTVELPAYLRLNSIRHLAARADGFVAFAMQWQGEEAAAPPLLGLHRRGAAPILAAAPDPIHVRMQGYAGSVAFSGSGAEVAITSPRGGLMLTFAADGGAFIGTVAESDICGVSFAPPGFLATSGTGRAMLIEGGRATGGQRHALAWDNHLVQLTAA